jgi:hypothetical protein
MQKPVGELGDAWAAKTKKWGLLIAKIAIKSPVPRSALFLK